MRSPWLALLLIPEFLLCLIVADKRASLAIALAIGATSVAILFALHKARVRLRSDMSRMRSAVDVLIAEKPERFPRS
jgi:hypothetical protein